MIEELAMHPPSIEMLDGNRLFDLRAGHTESSISRMILGPEHLPQLSTLASGTECNNCSFRTEFSQWTPTVARLVFPLQKQRIYCK